MNKFQVAKPTKPSKPPPRRSIADGVGATEVTGAGAPRSMRKRSPMRESWAGITDG